MGPTKSREGEMNGSRPYSQPLRFQDRHGQKVLRDQEHGDTGTPTGQPLSSAHRKRIFASLISNGLTGAAYFPPIRQLLIAALARCRESIAQVVR
jgi:hypothetical protein